MVVSFQRPGWVEGCRRSSKATVPETSEGVAGGLQQPQGQGSEPLSKSP